MKRLGLLVLLLTSIGFGQTTTIIGTIKDLTGATVTSGKITFTLNAPDSTAPGVSRFVSSTVSCRINSSGAPVSSVPPYTAPCTVQQNTALSPSGTSYAVCIQPYNVNPGGCFNFFAVTSTVDISTVAPTPTTMPTNYLGIQGPAGCLVGTTCAGAVPSVLNLAQLMTAITNCGTEACLITIAADITLTDNLTIPSNIAQSFINARFIVPSGVTLTDHGYIDAAAAPVFLISGSLQGLPRIKPEWLNGSNHLSAALFASISPGAVIELANATYVSDFNGENTCLNKAGGFYISGIQMPAYNSDGTALTGGSIVQGGFSSCGSDHPHIERVGFDVGSAFVGAGGALADALSINGASYQPGGGTNPSDPLVEHPVVNNVITLESAQENGYHNMLFEHTNNGEFSNLYVKYGTHGVALKSQFATLNGLHGSDCGAECLTIKGDNYTKSFHIRASNIFVSLDQGAPGSILHGVVVDAENNGTDVDVIVDKVQTIGATIPVTLLNGSSVTDAVNQVTISNVQAFITYAAGFNPTCFQSTGIGGNVLASFRWIALDNWQCFNGTGQVGSFAPAQVYNPMYESRMTNWNTVGLANSSTITGTIRIRGWQDVGPAVTAPTFTTNNSVVTVLNISGYFSSRPGSTPYLQQSGTTVFMEPESSGLSESADGTSMAARLTITGYTSSAVNIAGGTGATVDLAVQNAARTTNNFVVNENGTASLVGNFVVPSLTVTGISTSAVNHAACWKSGGVPGYCSTVTASDGSCTCN